MAISTYNPASGKILQTYDEMSHDDVCGITDSSHLAYMQWKQVELEKRIQPLIAVASHLRKNVATYATIISQEMGKPIVAAKAEIEKCSKLAEYYIDNIANLLAPKMVETESYKSFVSYQPTGIIFAIMPWNYPFWQVFRYALPNLTAGNACILKHAPNCTGCALAIESVFKACGYPENLFRSVVIDVPEVETLIKHPHISGVTLTGSERAGMAVASLAGQALKKVVLELGGSDPYIVLEDAHLEHAADCIVASRMNNTGQVCIAAKRILAVDAIRDELIQKVQARLADCHYGDPLDERTTMGPMARDDLRQEVHRQVLETVEKGANLVMGGVMPEDEGFYYPATLLLDVPAGSPAHDAEIFGPVVSFINVKDEAQAIRIANDSPYGLGSAVFTNDLSKGEYIATHQIEAGACVVNNFVQSDPRMPFGGIKLSGFGREMSVEGLHEFLNIKSVKIEKV